MPQQQPRPLSKTTIHVTNLSSEEKVGLKLMFEAMPGFRRMAFHSDYLFVCFSDLTFATQAINTIHTKTQMQASHAKSGILGHSQPSIPVPPSSILYVSLFPFLTEDELAGIFGTYAGYDSCRFFPNHALVRFKSVQDATNALESLNSHTNLFANFSTKGNRCGAESGNFNNSVAHSKSETNSALNELYIPSDQNASSLLIPKSDAQLQSTGLADPVSSMTEYAVCQNDSNGHINSASTSIRSCSIDSGTTSSTLNHTVQSCGNLKSNTLSKGFGSGNINIISQRSPKCTIHVTQIDKDMAGLYKMFKAFTGFSMIAFYPDYCFVCFKDIQTASHAIEEVLFKTRMKASFARADYTLHAISNSSIGAVNSIVRVADFPSTSTDDDLYAFFSFFEGFKDAQFYQASCLVYFFDTLSASAALNTINITTNFTAIFSKKQNPNPPTASFSNVPDDNTSKKPFRTRGSRGKRKPSRVNGSALVVDTDITFQSDAQANTALIKTSYESIPHVQQPPEQVQKSLAAQVETSLSNTTLIKPPALPRLPFLDPAPSATSTETYQLDSFDSNNQAICVTGSQCISNSKEISCLSSSDFGIQLPESVAADCEILVDRDVENITTTVDITSSALTSPHRASQSSLFDQQSTRDAHSSSVFNSKPCSPRFSSTPFQTAVATTLSSASAAPAAEPSRYPIFDGPLSSSIWVAREKLASDSFYQTSLGAVSATTAVSNGSSNADNAFTATLSTSVSFTALSAISLPTIHSCVNSLFPSPYQGQMFGQLLPHPPPLQQPSPQTLYDTQSKSIGDQFEHSTNSLAMPTQPLSIEQQNLYNRQLSHPYQRRYQHQYTPYQHMHSQQKLIQSKFSVPHPLVTTFETQMSHNKSNLDLAISSGSPDRSDASLQSFAASSTIAISNTETDPFLVALYPQGSRLFIPTPSSYTIGNNSTVPHTSQTVLGSMTKTVDMPCGHTHHCTCMDEPLTRSTLSTNEERVTHSLVLEALQQQVNSARTVLESIQAQITALSNLYPSAHAITPESPTDTTTRNIPCDEPVSLLAKTSHGAGSMLAEIQQLRAENLTLRDELKCRRVDDEQIGMLQGLLSMCE
ncbi:hypothetical protein QVD99_008557 [Batrachochytrium dendrobatidis]|nr:hypothetical protein O5D80_007426 [Batrachochytrium dendrobatidis]KAK5665023.1 hypothetical protein QVD99_008557 [Batrachochytrium dendrobatidis]